MSTPSRRAEMRAEQEKEEAAKEEKEEYFKRVGFWARIEAAEDINDIKQLLHLIAEKVNLE